MSQLMDLSKLFTAIAIAVVPMAPAGSYDFIWRSLVIQMLILVAIAGACVVDVTLGLLLAAFAISVSVQKRYTAKM